MHVLSSEGSLNYAIDFYSPIFKTKTYTFTSIVMERRAFFLFNLISACFAFNYHQYITSKIRKIGRRRLWMVPKCQGQGR